MKVLVVVEDDRDMQLLIELTLQADARLEVSGCCATAAEAIALARSMQPQLVILDHLRYPPFAVEVPPVAVM